MSQEFLEELDRTRTAEDVDLLLQRAYGDVSDLRLPAVIQPAAVWRSPSGDLLVLRIEKGTPASRADRFLLDLARARADAIVTTGKVLRDEPSLGHGLLSAEGPARALESWRRQRLGKRHPPLSLVLTSGRELDPSHPLFSGATGLLVFTSREGRRRLGDRLTDAGVEIHAEEQPSLRGALDLLRRRGARTISVEAGPSTSRDLYRPPQEVDELLLSIFAGELPVHLRGEPLLAPAELGERFRRRSRELTVRESSGLWRLRRYRR